MDVGIMYGNTGGFTGPQGAADLGRVAEQAGFESIWTVEHVIWPTEYEPTYPYSRNGRMPGDPSTPLPDPLVWLTWVGAHTSTIRLATGILILPQRNPLVLAKETATIDQLCGGRLELGIGVGWLREEFEALGVPFEGRGRRADEHIEAMRALWDADGADYHGRHVDFADVSVNPKPVGDRVPITIGGHTEAARAGPVGSATGSSPRAAASRSSPTCSTSHGGRPRTPGATRRRSPSRRRAASCSATTPSAPRSSSPTSASRGRSCRRSCSPSPRRSRPPRSSPSAWSSRCARSHRAEPGRRAAEADGNRTRQRLEEPLTGVEDRGTHQASGRLQGSSRLAVASDEAHR